jgi:ATP-binding cassette subfamily C (CFTR/MRP) protein 1
MATSNVIYTYQSQRVLVMIRGCLRSAIYQRTTLLKIKSKENSASVALMSTDAERINVGFQLIHDIWANTIEVGLAAWLLERQLGVSFLVPVGIIGLCVLGTIKLGKIAGPLQAAWMKTTEKRVGSTANIIMNMKSLKM